MIFFLKTLSYLLAPFPLGALQFLGGVLGRAVFYLVPFRREVVLENLRLAFGNELPETQIRRLAAANYVHYGKTLLEILSSLTWRAEAFRERVQVHGLEHVHAVLKTGKGGFLLTSHLGNWEFAICAAAAQGVPLDVVVKQARVRWAESLQQWYRRRTGAGVFLEEGTAKDILRSLSQGRFVGFILDQFMGPPIGLPVKFFGRTAGTAAALALMTDRREEPVIPVYSYRDPRGNLHTVFLPPVKFPQLPADKESRLYVKTQIFNDTLEQNVRAYPDQWLWLHRRWKPFRGESRWKLPSVISTVLLMAVQGGLLVLLSGCAGGPPKTETPTGISLPPDPTISVPTFSTEAAPTPTATPETEVPPMTKTTSKKKKSKKETPTTKTETVPAEVFYKALQGHQIPFEVGERLEMAMTWMALPAGKAVLEVKQGPAFAGRPTFHLWGNILSSKIVDAVYHVDNTIESYVDAQGLIPYKFLLHMVESKQNKETRVSFDHPQRKAYYWAKRISERWGNLDVDRVDTIEPAVRDMYSALYFARTLEYKLKEKQVFRVYENNEHVDVELTPVANELIVSKVGTFQCWKLAVTIKINNVLKPTGEMYLWVSDDLKKYPVRFDSKLKIGSLLGTLSSIRERL